MIEVSHNYILHLIRYIAGCVWKYMMYHSYGNGNGLSIDLSIDELKYISNLFLTLQMHGSNNRQLLCYCLDRIG